MLKARDMGRNMRDAGMIKCDIIMISNSICNIISILS